MNLKSLKNGKVINDIVLSPTNKIYSIDSNEAEVETVFESYLKDIGYGTVGELYTKRTAKSKLNTFLSKSGSAKGYPDYIFYDTENSNKIIAIGEAKKPDIRGGGQ